MLNLLTIVCLMQASQPTEFPSASDLEIAGRVIGIQFEENELEQMRNELRKQLDQLEMVRAYPLSWDEPFSLGFNPLLPGVQLHAGEFEAVPIELPAAERPANLNALAFADISTLAALIKSREVSCVELTQFFLDRLSVHNDKLNCVVHLTAERALAQARQLDKELLDGHWRGPLHGIPYGAKDLLAVAGYPTTWGAKPFESQRIEIDASVVQRLDSAGAVLIAKLSLGALAMGDLWFGGRTNNPWDLQRGSSGSSAGSAAASAAGLVPFAIGSETLGSIISPSVRCANSSLRPTFGRVPRGGAMPLSWTMDKLGVLGTSATDCAIVFDVLHGTDDIDPDAVDLPFTLSGPVDITGWKVGIFTSAINAGSDYARTVGELKDLGVTLVEIDLPDYPIWEMMLILMAEGACAFDELTRDGRDDQLTQQGDNAWPNLFRAARLIPAVEYIRANRLRTSLCRAMEGVMSSVDMYVHPPSMGDSLAITNLTGHPCVVVPASLPVKDRQPGSVCFTGQLYGEAKLLALVQRWQATTIYEDTHPAGY
ncbi:MAG: Asp-tRNA(Asn)/Glu-tRNA(Gln) amidotransferase A subunit family amidase [Planctomycetota bacterium]|jgi:Asp-tRNA(Asn)/Glu-tRNA(Gln) amidotransferase A subunit family amidase